jgi:general secretion pathway protein H
MQRFSQGFTLIELLVVLALIGLAAAVTTLALRDPDASRLEREAARLSALLESARAQSRASGVTVTWVPRSGGGASSGSINFEFKGLPETEAMPTQWMNPRMVAEVRGAKGLVLGPEPLIAQQQVTLRLDQQEMTLRTDGLGPFVVVYPPN